MCERCPAIDYEDDDVGPVDLDSDSPQNRRLQREFDTRYPCDNCTEAVVTRPSDDTYVHADINDIHCEDEDAHDCDDSCTVATVEGHTINPDIQPIRDTYRDSSFRRTSRLMRRA